MNQSSASVRKSSPLSPVNIALLEDAAKDLENGIEKILAPGHWPSWSDPDMPDGLALCVGCWRPITALQLGIERCPGRTAEKLVEYRVESLDPRSRCTRVDLQREGG